MACVDPATVVCCGSAPAGTAWSTPIPGTAIVRRRLGVAWPNPARAPASPNHHSPSPGPAAPFNQASVPSRPHRLAHAADRLRGTAQNPHSFDLGRAFRRSPASPRLAVRHPQFLEPAVGLTARPRRDGRLFASRGLSRRVVSRRSGAIVLPMRPIAESSVDAGLAAAGALTPVPSSGAADDQLRHAADGTAAPGGLLRPPRSAPARWHRCSSTAPSATHTCP